MHYILMSSKTSCPNVTCKYRVNNQFLQSTAINASLAFKKIFWTAPNLVILLWKQPTLNKFLEMGRPAWKEARATIQKLLSGIYDCYACFIYAYSINVYWGLTLSTSRTIAACCMPIIYLLSEMCFWLLFCHRKRANIAWQHKLEAESADPYGTLLLWHSIFEIDW